MLDLWQDFTLARYLYFRATAQKATLCVRKSDGTLWAALTSVQ